MTATEGATPTLVDGPPRASHTLVLAHGAGAAMDSPFLTEVASGLAERGVRVVRFEFPYMARARRGEKRGAPDRMPVLKDTFRALVRSLGNPAGLVVGGKSMGGRVATLVADELGAKAVVVFGYPFHPPGKPDVLRTEPLEALRTPCLILQGSRDPFGKKEEVERYALSPSVRVLFVEDGDHSLVPRKASGRTGPQNVHEAIEHAASFLLARGG